MSRDPVDHVATALAKLPEQFRDNESWIKTITALVRPMQALEDTLQDMLRQRQLAHAVGAQATTLGKKVGQARNGVTDNTIFLRYVRAKISANRSGGVIEHLIRISVLVIDDEDASHIVDNQGNAALVLRVEGVAVSEEVAEILIGFLRRAASTGVRIILESSTAAPASTFKWDTAGRGWDSGPFLDARD